MMRKLLPVLFMAACGPAARDNQPPDAPPPQPDAGDQIDTSRVFAHSGGVLYRMNNKTLAAEEIGALTGLGTQNLLDLAIDKDDVLVGITRDKLFSINASSGATTLIRALGATAQDLTSLSYVPQSLADPASPDILVSANDTGAVFQIDPATGNATQIGSYGTAAGGAVIKSSGDLFGVRGFGIYATVDVGTGTEDYLAKIDPDNGWKATLVGTGTGFDKIFGLGYWNGRIYGFVDNGFDVGGGKMIAIEPDTGTAALLTSDNIRWFGAGVATDAPVLQ